MSDPVARLWERFRPLVDQRVDLLRAHAEGDPGVPQEDALRAAHNLAGSLGSYGRRGGSETARRIEEALRQGVPPAGLAPLVDDLRAAVDD